MSIQVVTSLIWALNDYYKLGETLYKNRHYLDKTFSHFERFDEKDVIEMIDNIDKKFFEIFEDDEIKVKAFIFTILKSQF
ncbi:hypothetical protein [Helicobacter fennelliae]|uniref:Uncharacterized protein n=2 Tax=Helicobacter fennelliae TaxID=215 RepID=T1D021_9HELI|nr:hypothetical protein [Helicobacter fennelliae]GAD19520.1 hypothetical protein HFN_0760 [Helicobacter fennelliae MRY12-0050]SQB98465.1 Uncharacterised protein [Helicobacter fennelliae]STP07828.1 Uncharacterised protein [Helicobacter fennelliae]STQ84287.1 Uncharacterised protein [Helicobacter fennelliae]